MEKIITRIKGGVGNQLFCYAAARRLALVNDAELVIDDVTGFARDRQYQRQYALDRFHIPARKATPAERMEPFEHYRRGLAKFMARHRSFLQRRYIEQEGGDFDARLLDYKVDGTVHLDGLWQSENYFKDVEPTIRDDLRIIPPEDTLNQDMANRIRQCNAVAVHVRWFDPPEVKTAPHNISSEYYHRAVDEIVRRVSIPHYFLFSDDPASARQILALPEARVTCVNHNHGNENAYADLWLMSLCKNFIIANSSFSWWGAWLANFKSKIVIAQNIKISGLGPWGIDGLIPDDWVLL